MRRILLAAAALSLLTAPTIAQSPAAPSGGQPALPSVQLPAELDRVLRDYERAWRANDVPALVALFTEDGFVMQPGRAPARGRERLAEVYRGQGGGPLRLRALAFATADTVGYIIGAYGYGDEEQDQGKFTLALRRGRDRRWLIASDMDNGSTPPRRPGASAPPAAASAPPPATTPPPGVMRGRFVDDYGNAFEISDSLFAQLPHGRFHLVEWHVAEQFVVAHNDTANGSDPGLWSRIDWMLLPDMAPYTWGFCLTAYRAPSREAARATAPPDRRTPRTGCNGFPFSRMRPAEPHPPY